MAAIGLNGAGVNLIVLGVDAKEADVHRPDVEMNAGNETVAVATDVK